jgi:hypothetical protein
MAGEPMVTGPREPLRESERESYVRERGEEEEWSPPHSDKPEEPVSYHVTGVCVI